MKFIHYLLLGALVCSSGCIREGTGQDDCLFPLRLRFSYTYNREDRDLLREEVPTLSLRLFDSATGAQVRARDLSVSELDPDGGYTWDVPTGNYTLVSWGGIEERYSLAGPDAALTAHRASLPADGAEATASHRREHLWHALTTDLRVDGSLSPVHDVDLRKISNDVTLGITLAGGGAPTGPVESYVTATNSACDYSGHVPGDAPTLRYLPGEDRTDPARLTHNYTTLALSRDDDSRLFLSYAGTPVYDGSLTGLIARQPDIVFDLDDNFRLDFELTPDTDKGNMTVAVSVNSWRVTEYNVTLR